MRIVWPSLRRRAPRSKRAPRNASRGRRLSIAPSWRRGRRRLRMARGRRQATRTPVRGRPRTRSPDGRDLRIMPVAGGGFDQCYNAQAVVATASLLVIAGEWFRRPTTSSRSRRCWRRSTLCRNSSAGPNTVGRQWLFQRGQCNAVRGCQNRTADCDRAAAASPLLARAICRAAAGAAKPDTGRGHGLASADTARQTTLWFAQPDPGTGVRYHQIGDRIPPVPAAWTRSRSRRVEPRHHGLEHQENVCAQPGLSALPALRSNRCGGVQKSPRRHHVQSQQCSRRDLRLDPRQN